VRWICGCLNAVLPSPDFTPPFRFPTIQYCRLCRPSYTRLRLSLPSFPFPLGLLLPMMSRPLPCPVQWPHSWPDISAFANPDPSWFTYPTNPHPSRRRPYLRLEQAVASSSTSRSLHPRTRAPPLRAQVPHSLPMFPIFFPMESSTLFPSDPGSPMSAVAPPTLAPEFLHVVCNAPLLAPKPLPYRPPAFLDNFELPDPDEDLSHPPYTRSSSKRKRTQDGQDDLAATSVVSKRRANVTVLRGLNGIRSQRRFSK